MIEGTNMKVSRGKPVLLAASVGVACMTALSGCGNTLFFASEGKVAFDISAGEDPSQPVSVLIGYSRKVIAFVPPKNPAKNNEDTHHGEALSMISHFAAGRGNTGVGAQGTSYVEHAFISGDAATIIAGQKPEAVQSFLRGFQPIGLRTEAAQEAFESAVACVDEMEAGGDPNDLSRVQGSLGLSNRDDWGTVISELQGKGRDELLAFVADNCG